MSISEILVASMRDNGWNRTRLASAVGVTEAAVAKWIDRQAVPGGDSLLAIMRELPGFAERLGIGRLSQIQHAGMAEGLRLAREAVEGETATGHPVFEAARERGYREGLERWGRIKGFQQSAAMVAC